jgi:hypothetical protein
MRGSVGPPRPDQELIALFSRRKSFGSFAISGSLNTKPFFERYGLLEASSSLHDVLLSFRAQRVLLSRAAAGGSCAHEEMLRLSPRVVR